MTNPVSRRRLLAAGATALLAPALPGVAAQAQTAAPLTLSRRQIEVNGKAASVFGITGPGQKPGLTLAPGARFAVGVDNQCGADSIIHWHGQTPPPAQDGVTDTGYVQPIAPGGAQAYDFTARPGTHWMHSHQGLQEQQLMAAPLIVLGEGDTGADVQDEVVMLHDFTFRDPAEILAGLTARSGGSGGGMMGNMSGMSGMSGMMSGGGMGAVDINDINFDAYLANDRTLADLQIITAAPGAKLRLRFINGSSATGFWIDLGSLSGQLVAVDGDAVRPVTVTRFPLATAQRADVLLTLPGAGAFAVLALREGARERTGVIIATPGAAIPRLEGLAAQPAPPCDLSLESRLTAATPLAPRTLDQVFAVQLTGGMMGYNWGINGRQWQDRQNLTVKPGQRVGLEMVNNSMMPHPMHLHGHHFQVAGINGTAFPGAMRDTVLVPPMANVRIVFDADNQGRWLFHCHNLYHMAVGMMTELVYSSAS